ncbi:hypothetical protein A0O28_0104300 [Trichoderma guizhouense]|uniref:Uncharacterized protein n=1 Tax=Trichoderma guizhouense TaxID=1491466 RepID=A0A1T3CLC1_9HYPO|nr:hypothetical protein A0O28_0104300 [Trichoderma guizhouense]
MLSLASQIEAAASSPPIDAGERRALYDAAKKLLNVTEDPFDTIYRVNNSPMILTFSHIACELGIFTSLANSTVPVTTTILAQSSKADPLLLSMLITFAFNDVEHILYSLRHTNPDLKAVFFDS